MNHHESVYIDEPLYGTADVHACARRRSAGACQGCVAGFLALGLKHIIMISTSFAWICMCFCLTTHCEGLMSKAFTVTSVSQRGQCCRKVLEGYFSMLHLSCNCLSALRACCVKCTVGQLQHSGMLGCSRLMLNLVVILSQEGLRTLLTRHALSSATLDDFLLALLDGFATSVNTTRSGKCTVPYV